MSQAIMAQAKDNWIGKQHKCNQEYKCAFVGNTDMIDNYKSIIRKYDRNSDPSVGRKDEPTISIHYGNHIVQIKASEFEFDFGWCLQAKEIGVQIDFKRAKIQKSRINTNTFFEKIFIGAQLNSKVTLQSKCLDYQIDFTDPNNHWYIKYLNLHEYCTKIMRKVQLKDSDKLNTRDKKWKQLKIQNDIHLDKIKQQKKKCKGKKRLNSKKISSVDYNKCIRKRKSPNLPDLPAHFIKKLKRI
ncbi:MAG: hypothetical protein GY928_12160 [Colwellia sp.]|nr:hypothetical protein [Colwellia sp.]